MKKTKSEADDVWYEIFLHFPLDSVYGSKSVSKVWLSTLSNPNFINHWYKLNKSSLVPWGLLHFNDSDVQDHNTSFRRMFTIACPDSHSQFIENHQNGFSLCFLNQCFPICNIMERLNLVLLRSSISPSISYRPNVDLYLIGSSSGLVLCTTNLFYQIANYVCNPLTKKWVSLPPPPPRENKWAVSGFMCDECFSESTSYKVIRIPRFKTAAKEFQVDVFCSDLGEWNVYGVSCPQDVTWNFCRNDNLITCSGVLYWFQKRNSRILAITVNENTNHGTHGYEGRLINLPHQAMNGDLELHHHLGESEGLICYAMVNGRNMSLSVWVLGEDDWYLLYKDDKFHEFLAEMETSLIGAVALISQIRVLGFSPVDKYVVILGYGMYICAYNTRTKGYEPLSHPSFLGFDGSDARASSSTFALKPRPTVVPPVSW